MDKWTKEDITRMKRLYKKGLTVKAIALQMNKSSSAITYQVNKLQKSGELPFRNRRKGVRAETPKSKAGDSYYFKKTLDFPTAKDVYGKAMVKAYKNLGVRTSTAQKIQSECDKIKAFLIAKNEAYGDSAITPIRIFSQADASEQIKVRIDDKLNRLVQGTDTIETDEDVIKDLIGYLILLMVQLQE